MFPRVSAGANSPSLKILRRKNTYFAHPTHAIGCPRVGKMRIEIIVFLHVFVEGGPGLLERLRVSNGNFFRTSDRDGLQVLGSHDRSDTLPRHCTSLVDDGGYFAQVSPAGPMHAIRMFWSLKSLLIICWQSKVLVPHINSAE